VSVDDARRDDAAVGVDDVACLRSAQAADRRDLAVPYADVAPIAGKPGSIDHDAVLD
jgi:hypothetical protein